MLDALRREGLVEHVAAQGLRLRELLARELSDIPMVGEVRGQGYLLGVEYVDPRDGTSLLPASLGVAGRIDDAAFAGGLVTLSTQPTNDGYAGDQSLFAPAFTSTDGELAEMVTRFGAAVRAVAEEVDRQLASAEAPPLAATPGASPTEARG